MKREIKFRGLRVYDRQWAFGFLSEPNTINTEVVDDTTGFLTYDDYSVIPDSVGQFTGLKDSNGTDVYEGDLVKLTHQYIYEVRFEDGKFVGYHIKQEWGTWGDLKRLSDPDFAHCHHEVIGNIFENPELLTQQTTQ